MTEILKPRDESESEVLSDDQLDFPGLKARYEYIYTFCKITFKKNENGFESIFGETYTVGESNDQSGLYYCWHNLYSIVEGSSRRGYLTSQEAMEALEDILKTNGNRIM